MTFGVPGVARSCLEMTLRKRGSSWEVLRMFAYRHCRSLELSNWLLGEVREASCSAWQLGSPSSGVQSALGVQPAQAASSPLKRRAVGQGLLCACSQMPSSVKSLQDWRWLFQNWQRLLELTGGSTSVRGLFDARNFTVKFRPFSFFLWLGQI